MNIQEWRLSTGAAGHNNGASHITLSHNNPLSEEYNSLA